MLLVKPPSYMAMLPNIAEISQKRLVNQTAKTITTSLDEKGPDGILRI